MRHFFFISQKAFLMVLFIMAFAMVKGQQPNFTCELRNDYQEDARNIVFDVYIVNTSPGGSPVFEYAQGQLGITFNSAIKNGGTLSATVVDGYSDLSPDQQWLPANVSIVTAGLGGIKVTARTSPPGPGFGDIISTVAPGTRMARFRLTNTVDFGQAQANFAFNFLNNPWPTKMSAYLPALTNITSTGTFLTSNMTNPILNKPVTAYNVTGSGSYCAGGTGLAVGLAGSETGVTYKLVKDGTPTATTMAGTGSALSFGLQTVGTYTVTGARNATFITGNMTSSAIITIAPAVTPDVSIVASSNPVLAGTLVTFTPMPVNGGASPTYQWFVNNISAGTGATYAYTPVNGDAVKAVMTSSLTCVTSPTATSSPVTMTVNPVWTGSVSSDWTNTQNWNPISAPTSSLNAYIPASATNMPVITQGPGSPVICNNLTIENGASVTVAGGGAFTVTGTVTNNAGNSGLIVNSDAGGTGSLIINTAGVSGIVQRYISHWTDNNHGYHFLSSPVADQAIQPTFVPANPGSAQDFYAWDEVNGWWFNSKDAGLQWVPGFDASFVPGKGYLVAYQGDVTKPFTGTLNVSNVTKPGLTFTSPGNYTGDVTPGWNLLGNPFASAITWNTAGWSPVNIAAIAKIWNESSASYTDISTGGIIPSRQGFMVNVITGTGSLTIPASARAHSTTPWYKSTDNPVIKLVAHNLDAQTAQESVVASDNQATTGYEPAFDSRFFPGYAPQFYSVEGTDHLSTNVIPDFGSQTTIPFSFIKTEGNNYTIEAAMIENVPSQVYLTDLKTNYTQNLVANPEYAFTASEGDDPARFLLSFSHVGIGENPVSGNGIYSYENNLCIVNPGKARLEMFTLTGQKLLTQEINCPVLFKTALYVPTAYYIVRLTSGTRVVVTKVFIKS